MIDPKSIAILIIAAAATKLGQLIMESLWRKTQTLTEQATPIIRAIFRRDFRILPVILDVFVLASGAVVLIWSCADNQPATTRFVAATEILCLMVAAYGVALRRDWRRFRPQSLTDLLA